jgi:hypothetical protein
MNFELFILNSSLSVELPPGELDDDSSNIL